jgi:hypothetical protein
LGDDLDSGGKPGQATGVTLMRVGNDDCFTRLVADDFDLLDQYRTSAGILGVDDYDTILLCDKHRSVAAASFEHIEVISDLQCVNDLGLFFTRLNRLKTTGPLVSLEVQSIPSASKFSDVIALCVVCSSLRARARIATMELLRLYG